MDSKFLVALLLFVLKLKSAWSESDDVTMVPIPDFEKLVIESDNEMCTTKLGQCSLKLGTKYYKGNRGTTGPKGELGLKGEKGEVGNQGPLGWTGDAGSKGASGDEGLRGSKGEAGEEGPRGPPGLPGVEIARPSRRDKTAPANLGSRENPLKKLCKDYPYFVRDGLGKTFFIQKRNTKDLIEVKCTENGWTCIVNNKMTPEFNYTDKMGPFWLSDLEFNMIDLYGVTLDDISYLKYLAASVRQKIRYHCKNSAVLPKNKNRALQVLLWNDVLLEPYPGDITPLYYSIIEDNCKELSEPTLEWASSEITIWDTVQRLPITDLRIRDVQRGEQSLKLEFQELCFG